MMQDPFDRLRHSAKPDLDTEESPEDALSWPVVAIALVVAASYVAGIAAWIRYF